MLKTEFPNTVAAATALTDAEIAAAPGPALVTIYNLLTEGEEVKRFATRADGVKRVTKLVAAAREATKIRESDPNVKAWNEMTNALAKHTAPAKVNSHTAAPAKVGGTIRLLVATNPKRPGSAAHDRFACYRDGMTVADYLAAGGQRLDLRYDADHGFIHVEK